MRVTFFGVRGSYPVPNKEMMEYGGRTSSVMISKEYNGKVIPLFIDAGNGIIEAGNSMIPGLLDGSISKEFTLLFTHLHPDHTEGFTFFTPNFMPGIKIHLLGPSFLKKNVGMVLRDKMAPPTYPIEYKDLKSERIHGVVEDGEIWYISPEGKPNKNPGNHLLEIKVMQSFAPSHPQQGCIYYRITDAETKKSVACIWDNESRKGGDQRVIAFSKDADVMIHDTQYTEEEYDSGKMVVQGFGHSTYTMAVENARLAGVKCLVGFHYNPMHTDHKLKSIADDVIKQTNNDLEFILSKEGLSLDL